VEVTINGGAGNTPKRTSVHRPPEAEFLLRFCIPCADFVACIIFGTFAGSLGVEEKNGCKTMFVDHFEGPPQKTVKITKSQATSTRPVCVGGIRASRR